MFLFNFLFALHTNTPYCSFRFLTLVTDKQKIQNKDKNCTQLKLDLESRNFAFSTPPLFPTKVNQKGPYKTTPQVYKTLSHDNTTQNTVTRLASSKERGPNTLVP